MKLYGAFERLATVNKPATSTLHGGNKCDRLRFSILETSMKCLTLFLRSIGAVIA